jgi:hypothetical protein
MALISFNAKGAVVDMRLGSPERSVLAEALPCILLDEKASYHYGPRT